MQEPVDVSSLVLLRQLQQPGKPDVVARIIGRFLEETDERVLALRSATESRDSDALEHAAHALKGIAGTVGANEILQLAVSLEQIGRDGRTEGAADLVADLELAVRRARPIFDRLRQPAQSE
jgi:HPt (histidine-containing phosphotransfer) domain-containing protein